MTAICTPSSASASQIRCPSPPLPPVINATAPLNSISFLLREGFGHRRIDQGAQVAAQGQARLAADHLGHEHDRQLFLRVDPEGGRGGAAPEILAEPAWQAGFGDLYVDPAAEREADAGI